jgi:site-specific DNA recombinase
MRIAIYARYSSEHQHEHSIDDQVRLCRERASAMGGNVVGVYADYAVSGAHLKSRPEACRLLKESQENRFDMVIAEALDRLSAIRKTWWGCISDCVSPV